MKRPSSPKDQLLDTAARLFFQKGYRAIGVDTITAESGIGKMTLYRHFDSKDDLIVAVPARERCPVLGGVCRGDRGGSDGAGEADRVLSGALDLCDRPGLLRLPFSQCRHGISGHGASRAQSGPGTQAIRVAAIPGPGG